MPVALQASEPGTRAVGSLSSPGRGEAEQAAQVSTKDGHRLPIYGTCMCVYMSIYIYMRIYTIYTYARPPRSATYTSTCIYTKIIVCIYVCIYLFTSLSIYPCTRIQRFCIHNHICIIMHVYIHLNTYTYTYTLWP